MPVAGAPRLLRAGARAAVPSPDSQRLAFLSHDRAEIWVTNAGGHAERLLAAGGEDSFSYILWSPAGRSLLVQRRHVIDQDLGSSSNDRFIERSLESVDVSTGKVVFRVPNFWFDSAAALPDGRIRFLKYPEPGSHYPYELWEVKADRATGRFLEAPRNLGRPVERYGGYLQGITSTSDGKQVALLLANDQHATYVADLQRAPLRIANAKRLTQDSGRSFPHAWTLDSSTLIFESERLGSWDIFSQRIDQRTPTPIAATPLRAEVLAQVTPDGQSILYAASASDDTSKLDTLLRVPLAGGIPAQVPTGGPLGEFRCSTGPAGRCVLRRNENNRYFVFYALDPVQGAGPELTRTEWSPSLVGDWDISPDGRQVAIPNHSSRSAVIRLVALEAAGPRSRAITLTGLSDIRGVSWSADGKGWFISLLTSIGDRTVYADSESRVSSIGSLLGTVPAPSGQRVAYVEHIVAADAWILTLL